MILAACNPMEGLHRMNQKRFLLLLVAALALAAGTMQPAVADPPPDGWKTEDIGNPEPPGKTEVEGTGAEAKWTVTGTGSDIWGSADQFQFAYTELKGDGGVTARLLSIEGGRSDGLAKAGVMLRESTERGSRMAMLVYTNGNRLQGSFRVEPNETPVGLTEADGRMLEGGPIWMRVQRQGQLYQLLVSDDGKSWTLLARRTMPIDAGKPVLAGLAATMHGGDKPLVATFDNVSVSADLIKPVPAGPAPVVAVPGPGAVLITYGLVPEATGYNIYRQGPDDKEPVKVNADATPNGWFVDEGPGGKGLMNGVSYRYTVRAVLEGEDDKPVESAASAVVLAEPQVPIAPGFISFDIGTLTPGSTRLESDVLTITGSGQDIWNATDSFRFVAIPKPGDYTMTAKLLEKPAPGEGSADPWAKAGLMIRESLDSGARFGMVLATPREGVHFFWRRGYRMDDLDNLSSAAGTGDAETVYPLFLRIRRVGDTITAFQSEDGTNFTPVGEPVTFPNLSETTFAGFAVTARAEGKVVSAKFDAASVIFE
jgi:hypothetical protein